MGLPTRRGGVQEPPLSICPRTFGHMTMVMYQQFRLWIAGITTYRTEDTTGHNLIHVLSIRAVHLLLSCPTRFPDCVGLVPNSTATTLGMVKALDIGSSSRSMGHNGLGTDPALHHHSHDIIHHTSTFSIGTYLFRHLSHIRIASPLGFCFISRPEGKKLTPLRHSCNRCPSFIHTFQSSLGIYFYSACIIP